MKTLLECKNEVARMYLETMNQDYQNWEGMVKALNNMGRNDLVLSREIQAHEMFADQLNPPFDFLLGKKIRYRYVDWEPGSYSVWITCTEDDLKKLEDRSLESIEFKL